VSASKIWLITIAFLAGTFITPFLLILTTGGDDASLPPFRASPISDSSGLSLQQTAPTKFTPPDESITSAHVMASLPVASPTPPQTPPSVTPKSPASPSPSVVTDVSPITGRFRITDTIISGKGTGAVVSFDVELQQAGSGVSGGNGEIKISGTMDGSTLRAHLFSRRLVIRAHLAGESTVQVDLATSCPPCRTPAPAAL
jgi:hypothetical protein